MKREMITVKTPEGLVLKVPAHVVATTFIAAALAQVGATQQVADDAITAAAPNVPRIGDYWLGQGGHNAGFVPEQDGTPAHYLIVGAQDLGDHAWGGRGKEAAATSKRDGLANTQALLLEGDHPAAKACAEYQADNHRDFYLPACAELYQAWLSTPGLLAKDCWYWSSTQRSANYAFTMDFGAGNQGLSGKDNELRVRPVRRFFI